MRASRGNARVRRRFVLDVEACDARSRAREILIKAWPRHPRKLGYFERAELRKAAGRGKNCIGLEHRAFIDFTEVLQATTKGRANDGLDDVSGNMAVMYFQVLCVAASERRFSYGIDARRPVGLWAAAE